MRVLFFILLSSIFQGTNSTCARIRENVTKIKNIPYPELAYADSVYISVVKEGLDAVPCLIEMLDDTCSTDIAIPNFGETYSRGELALGLINQIISFDVENFIIQNKHLLLVDSCYDYRIGYGNVHLCVFSSFQSQKLFKKELSEWFSRHDYVFVNNPVVNHETGDTILTGHYKVID